MSKNDDHQGNATFLFFAAIFIAFMAIPAWYAAKAGIINGALVALSKFQLKVFIPFSEEAQRAWEHISGLDPAALTWEKMQAILSYTGKWIRWPFALFLVLLGMASIFMGRVKGLVRRLNMDSLLKNNSESFPCLHPIVGRGKELLDPKSYDSGNWRIAGSPLQFAVEHGLLLDGNGAAYTPDQVLRRGLGHVDLPAYGHARLDAGKTLTVLQTQLGPVFGGFAVLAPGRQALTAAFLAYAGGDKKECVALLNDVSISYTEQNGVVSCAVLENEDFRQRLEALREKHKDILSEPLLTRHTAFELVWCMALLTRARKKGVLASSQFLWLRPLDRPLWYALNQCGGRAAWVEGFAPWAHYAAEEKAGKSINEPRLAQAVAALRDALAAQGWLTDKPLPAAVAPKTGEAPGAPAPEPIPNATEPDADMVYAPAEDVAEDVTENFMDEYDANNDPSLPREQF